MFTKKKESEELETPKMRISHCFQIQIFGKKKKKKLKRLFQSLDLLISFSSDQF